MPQVIDPPTRTMPPANPPRIRWNADQYESLFTMGLLPEKGFELIEGDIIQKMSIKDAHAYVITTLFLLFVNIVEGKRLRSAFTLYIDEESLPEPDFAVLTEARPTLTARNFVPTSAAQLVVEVSDATLSTDLTTKARLYARAGIPEYWVVDITGRRLLIHAIPGEDGYTQVTEYSDTDTAAPLFLPSATFPVADILP